MKELQCYACYILSKHFGPVSWSHDDHTRLSKILKAQGIPHYGVLPIDVGGNEQEVRNVPSRTGAEPVAGLSVRETA